MEHLKSNLHLFDAHLRLLIAIACKLATLKVFANRYASLDDDAAWDEEEPSDADTSRRELKAEQKLAAKLQSTTSKEAAAWLALVCAHLQVDLASLPSSPSPDPLFAEAVPDTLRFEIAHELVLVSLGLAIPADAPPPELNYSALSRALVVRAAATLGIQLGVVESAEKAISQFLYFQLKAVEDQEGANGKGDWDEAASAGRKEASGKRKALKWAATGAGFVLGGVAIGLTGGLAAPALAPLLAGTLGLTFFGTAGGAILIGTLLGLGGGGLASYRTHRRMKGLDELSFESIKLADVPSIPSLTATIVCSGFLLAPEDSVEPWQATFENSGKDVFALKADPETFLAAGQALDHYVRDKLIRTGSMEVVKRTALAAVYAGVALPLSILSSASMLLDSDFSRCRDKAVKAGVLLAEIIEKQIQGNRPCILLGYGPGATIIFECLRELHKRQQGALVYSAILISLPSSPSTVSWASARSVVAHRLVNVYSTNDWVLAISARVYTLSAKVAGLRAVEALGVENVDCSDLVGGHLELRERIGEILERVAKETVGKEGDAEVKA